MSLVLRNRVCLEEPLLNDPISEVNIKLLNLSKLEMSKELIHTANTKYDSFTSLSDLETIHKEYSIIASPGHESICSVGRLIKTLENKFKFNCMSFWSGMLLLERDQGCTEAFSVTLLPKKYICDKILNKLYSMEPLAIGDEHFYGGTRYYLSFYYLERSLRMPTLAWICFSPEDSLRRDEYELGIAAIVL